MKDHTLALALPLATAISPLRHSIESRPSKNATELSKTATSEESSLSSNSNSNSTSPKQKKCATNPPPVHASEIYLRIFPPVSYSAERLTQFLNGQMRKLRLCTHGGAVLRCTTLLPRCDEWTAVMANNEMAEKAMYLNCIRFNQSNITLRRHEDYKGPPPNFFDYQELFSHHHHHYQDKTLSKKPIAPLEGQTVTGTASRAAATY
jgi:hypothetical protein